MNNRMQDFEFLKAIGSSQRSTQSIARFIFKKLQQCFENLQQISQDCAEFLRLTNLMRLVSSRLEKCYHLKCWLDVLSRISSRALYYYYIQNCLKQLFAISSKMSSPEVEKFEITEEDLNLYPKRKKMSKNKAALGNIWIILHCFKCFNLLTCTTRRKLFCLATMLYFTVTLLM